MATDDDSVPGTAGEITEAAGSELDQREAAAQSASMAAEVLRPGVGPDGADDPGTTSGRGPVTGVPAGRSGGASVAGGSGPGAGADTAALGSRGHSHGAGSEVPGVRLHREGSFDVSDFPVPHGREEEWRFTPLEPLEALLRGESSEARLELTSDVPDGATLERVGADEPSLRDVPLPVDRLSALAVANAGGALRLTVAAEAELDRPVLIQLEGTGGDAVVWEHVVLDVEPFAKATVVVEHTGTARFASSVSVLVGDGASLDLVHVQTWGKDAVHSAHVATRLGRDARLRSTQVTLGGELVRVVETVEYAAPGGDAELLGLYFADSGQHLEHRLFVDHALPHCRSRVTYKGALQGAQARTVWIGDVLIQSGAEGTDTYEQNRNLVLTDGARADSVPNLEIETGEIVGAGHASTTGRFDDEQLFYLQARGIPEDAARRLVVRGFFNDVVQRVGVPALRERLMAAVDAELEGASA